MNSQLCQARSGARARFLIVTALASWTRPGQGMGFLKHQQAPPRIMACQDCYRSCTMSCSVGTCGAQYGYSVQRHSGTGLCYSCDAVSSVSTMLNGDFSLCSAGDAGHSDAVMPMGSPPNGVGAPLPNDPAGTSGAASVSAQETVVNAEHASSQAAQAAREALGHYNAMSSNLATAGDAAAAAQRRQMAAQIAANSALEVAQAAHVAWEEALKTYNGGVNNLRAQQLRTDQFEERLARAETSSEAARMKYVKMADDAAQAARDAAMSGDDTSAAMAAQAQAMELAASARAAQRRLVVSAKAANEARIKLGVAAGISLPGSLEPQPTLPPCGSFAQFAGPSHTDCSPPGGAAAPQISAAPQSLVATRASTVPQALAAPLADTLPAAPVQGPQMQLMSTQRATTLGGTAVDAAVDVGMSAPPDEATLSQQMVAQLAQRLTEDPNAASDASLFGAPVAMPPISALQDQSALSDASLFGAPSVGAMQAMPGMAIGA